MSEIFSSDFNLLASFRVDSEEETENTESHQTCLISREIIFLVARSSSKILSLLKLSAETASLLSSNADLD